MRGALVVAALAATLIGAGSLPGTGPEAGQGTPGATLWGRVELRGYRPASEAAVYLEPTGPHAPIAPPGRGPFARIDQHGLEFDPHVIIVPVGAVVEFANSDTVLHNIFSPQEGDGGAFDLGTWPRGETRSHRFDHAGVTLLLCRVHPEMEAFVVVAPSPWYAITDERGAYRIPDVPPGEYTLRAWHERGQPMQEVVTIARGLQVRRDLVLEPLF